MNAVDPSGMYHAEGIPGAPYPGGGATSEGLDYLVGQFFGSWDETAYGRFNVQVRPSQPDAVDVATNGVGCTPIYGIPANAAMAYKHFGQWKKGEATMCDVVLDVAGIPLDAVDWAKAAAGSSAVSDFIWLTLGEGFGQEYPLIYADPAQKL